MINEDCISDEASLKKLIPNQTDVQNRHFLTTHISKLLSLFEKVELLISTVMINFMYFRLVSKA